MNEKLDKNKSLEDELNKIRGERWIRYLMQVGNFKTQAAMHEALNVINNVQMWSQYNKGSKTPVSSTVKVINQKIYGSADVWFKGYEDLPLWDVLLGNEDVCISFIDEVLANAKVEDWMFKTKKSIQDMTISEKFYSILQIVTDKKDWAVKQVFNESKATKSLSEILDFETNLISKHYDENYISFAKYQRLIEGFVGGEINPEYGYKGKKFKSVIKKERQKNNSLSNPEYVLVLMAFYILFKQQVGELDVTTEFIKNGISKAVLDTFGNRIHNYLFKI